MPVDGVEIRQLLCSTNPPVHCYGTQQWPRRERVCARKLYESGLSDVFLVLFARRRDSARCLDVSLAAYMHTLQLLQHGVSCRTHLQTLRRVLKYVAYLLDRRQRT